jgi:UPF0042 nucleotide-binding protein
MSEFVLITGLSGAGGSQAANVFEDLGWFVIDNLPPTLIEKVADLAQQPGSTIERVALVVRARNVAELTDALDHLRREADAVRIVFLDASDEVLVRRYEDTRRRHPHDEGGLSAAIAAERAALEPLKAEADVVVDTTDLNVHQLRDRLQSLFAGGDPAGGMQTSVMSFGYKHGLPMDVDLVIDCRFLPNPHWVDELRPHTGLDPDVRDYVFSFDQTSTFMERLGALLDLLLPAYVAEGKSYLTLAMGCTGGRHRSVAIAEAVAEALRERGFEPRVVHRDVAR